MSEFIYNSTHKQFIIFSAILYLAFSPLKSKAQNIWKSKGYLYEIGNSKIELHIMEAINHCKTGKKNKFKITNTNISNNLDRIPNYCSWKMEVKNCDDDIIIKTFCINLGSYNADGDIADNDWNFEAKEIIIPIYEIKLTNFPIRQPDITKQKQTIQAPDYITGPQKVMSGEEFTLTVNGGNLNVAGHYKWFSANCGGLNIGSGKSLTLKTNVSAIYYVRIEEYNQKTTCVSYKVNVDNLSQAPSRILGETNYCLNSLMPIKLEVQGGKLGLNANWVWYKDSIISFNKLGQGSNIILNKPFNGKIFVRAEGSNNITSAISQNIKINNLSIPPKNLILDKSIICPGELVRLQINDGLLSEDAMWVVYENDISFNRLIKSSKNQEVLLNPNQNTKFIVRGEGLCGNTIPIETEIKVLENSIKPVDIQFHRVSNDGNKFNFTLKGGDLGDQASWIWTKDNCNNKPIGYGENIKVRISQAEKIFVKAEGICNKTDCISVSPLLNVSRYNFKIRFINIGLVTNTFKNTPSVNLTLGSDKYYIRIKNNVNILYTDRPIITEYETNNQKITNYKNRNTGYTYIFNGKTASERESYTLGHFFKIIPNIRLYLGMGYGKYNLFWSINEYYSNISEPLENNTYAKYIAGSYSGFELETGIMLRINKINIISGFNGILSFTKEQFIDASIGIGYSF